MSSRAGTIVVGVDCSSSSQEALTWAAEQAQAEEAPAEEAPAEETAVEETTPADAEVEAPAEETAEEK